MGYYVPTCAASCSTATLPDFGETGCASETSVEIAEIVEIFLSEKSSTVGIAENPITGWTSVGLAANESVNEAAILTWIGLAAQTGLNKVRRMEVIGEKGEPESTEVDLPKSKKFSTGTKHRVSVSQPIMDQKQYEACRALQCKGEFHFWYATDKALYGGIQGIICTIEKANFIFSGKSPKTFNMVISWSETFDPPRDKKPFA